ncbi:MAG TPA: hypothetical protein VHI98_30315 [Vicinamibacterales bacterium]|jgi:hypothetical protein|nr:hypothetical protein [Vicinamibacterales bacterium]HEX2460231.1 hypothetical protein [Vicinamibacterales bacterium]
MRKTIEATWREGFLDPDALVAPKVNDLYTRKSTHIVDRIQRMQRINEIAIVIGAPVMWAFLSAVGIPYTGAIICTAWVGLLVVRRLYVTKFDAPDSSLDSYQYLKAFQRWLKNRIAWGRSVQRHLYAVTFLALAIGIAASASGQLLIRLIVESNPDVSLVNGVPLVLIAGVVATAIVVDLLGGVIFDFDVNTVYRSVFRKLDQMVSEMEELRG